MLLGGINILGWYSEKGNRVWDSTKNREKYILTLPEGIFPSVQLLVDDASTATIQVFNAMDDQSTGAKRNMTIVDLPSYKSLIFLGVDDHAYQNCGFHYFIVETDSDTFYSDVFYWAEDVSELLKIEITSSPVGVDPYNKYVNSFSGMTYLFYLNAIEGELETDIQEIAESKNGIDEVLYGSTSILRSFEILGNMHIYIFLCFLDTLSVNGIITITWKSEPRYARDVKVEKAQVFNASDLYSIKLSYKCPTETIFVINTIV